MSIILAADFPRDRVIKAHSRFTARIQTIWQLYAAAAAALSSLIKFAIRQRKRRKEEKEEKKTDTVRQSIFSKRSMVIVSILFFLLSLSLSFSFFFFFFLKNNTDRRSGRPLSPFITAMTGVITF